MIKEGQFFEYPQREDKKTNLPPKREEEFLGLEPKKDFDVGSEEPEEKKTGSEQMTQEQIENEKFAAEMRQDEEKMSGGILKKFSKAHPRLTKGVLILAAASAFLSAASEAGAWTNRMPVGRRHAGPPPIGGIIIEMGSRYALERIRIAYEQKVAAIEGEYQQRIRECYEKRQAITNESRERIREIEIKDRQKEISAREADYTYREIDNWSRMEKERVWQEEQDIKEWREGSQRAAYQEMQYKQELIRMGGRAVRSIPPPFPLPPFPRF